MARWGRKGFYEILLVFVLIVVLVVSVLVIIHASESSARLFAGVQRQVESPLRASSIKDGVLACHRLEYLDADLFARPCAATGLERGIVVRQLPLNGCPAVTWNFSKGPADQIVPFVVTVEQNTSAKRCLAILDVRLGGTA